jgi:hypothetical protein
MMSIAPPIAPDCSTTRPDLLDECIGLWSPVETAAIVDMQTQADISILIFQACLSGCPRAAGDDGQDRARFGRCEKIGQDRK